MWKKFHNWNCRGSHRFVQIFNPKNLDRGRRVTFFMSGIIYTLFFFIFLLQICTILTNIPHYSMSELHLISVQSSFHFIPINNLFSHINSNQLFLYSQIWHSVTITMCVILLTGGLKQKVQGVLYKVEEY